MSRPEYRWRRLTPEQRVELLAWRKANQRPWHSPPHRADYGHNQFHISAACYDHRPWIGQTPERMEAFARDLLAVLSSHAKRTFAWTLLPNHYHALVEVHDIRGLLRQLGLFHGRTSYAWNGEEDRRGRKVFFRATDRAMRNERHYWTTLNYVHHNPVHHGYVEKWSDWPWGSAADCLAQMGPLEAKRIWLEYPLRGYGQGWDDALL